MENLHVNKNQSLLRIVNYGYNNQFLDYKLTFANLQHAHINSKGCFTEKPAIFTECKEFLITNTIQIHIWYGEFNQYIFKAKNFSYRKRFLTANKY